MLLDFYQDPDIDMVSSYFYIIKHFWLDIYTVLCVGDLFRISSSIFMLILQQRTLSFLSIPIDNPSLALFSDAISPIGMDLWCVLCYRTSSVLFLDNGFLSSPSFPVVLKYCNEPGNRKDSSQARWVV